MADKKNAPSSKDIMKKVRESPKKIKEKLSKVTSPTKSAPKAQASTLSVGVELEFIITHWAYPKKVDQLPESDKGAERAFAAIAGALYQQKLTANCGRCGNQTNFTLSVDPKNEKDDPFGVWTFCVPYTITVRQTPAEEKTLGDSRGCCEFFPVAIRSRKMSVSEPLQTSERCTKDGKPHVVPFTEEIKALLNHLHSVFGFATSSGKDQKGSYHMYSNSNCGFHVSISDENGLSLQTARNVYALSIACERQIDGLHSLDRIVGTDLLFRVPSIPKGLQGGIWEITTTAQALPPSIALIVYAQNRRQLEYNEWLDGRVVWKPSTSSNPRLGYPDNMLRENEIWNARMGSDIDSWLTLIQAAPNLQALADLRRGLNENTGSTIDIPNPAEARESTLQFRQHKSSLDAQCVLSWLDFCVRLVLSCSDGSGLDLKGLIGTGSTGNKSRRGESRNVKFRGVDLCSKLKCSEDTLNFYKSQLNAEHSSTLRQEEYSNAKQAMSKGNPLGSLFVHVIEQERSNIDSVKVQDHIHEKLQFGGYGQFAMPFLDAALDPYKARFRQTLEVGFLSVRVDEWKTLGKAPSTNDKFNLELASTDSELALDPVKFNASAVYSRQDPRSEVRDFATHPRDKSQPAPEESKDESGHWEFLFGYGRSEWQFAQIQFKNQDVVPHQNEVTADEVAAIQAAFPERYAGNEVDLIWVPDGRAQDLTTGKLATQSNPEEATQLQSGKASLTAGHPTEPEGRRSTSRSSSTSSRRGKATQQPESRTESRDRGRSTVERSSAGQESVEARKTSASPQSSAKDGDARTQSRSQSRGHRGGI